MIGFAVCASYCCHHRALEALTILQRTYSDILPILSENAATTDTRFGSSRLLQEKLSAITGKQPILTIHDAEPLGPKTPLEALIIAPCTGNTLAKMAHGITDTTVTMAAKAHLRADRPLLIALATNDALSANLANLALLLSRKNIYFTPMLQDDPLRKPHSLIAEMERIPEAFAAMTHGKQLYPLFTTA
ncbi:MAG: dipicolinate synthase subunit B [Clostridia bacterium]|nr:dipicolinate synthase subunit B [Clostridia bacterium]